ncbi:hypothetical protein V8D89_008381 [Ganoderma adspersum]
MSGNDWPQRDVQLLNTYYAMLASSEVVTTIATCTTVASNAVLIILTWVKTFGIYKTLSGMGMRTPLMTLLIHGGTVYFVILLLSLIVAILCKVSPLFAFSTGPFKVFVVVWPYIDDVSGPICLSRFLLDACSVSFTNRRSHMGIPGADLSVSLSPSEVSEMRFNASRITENLITTRTDVPPDVESSRTVSYSSESEEVERDGFPTITKDTCTRDPRIGRAL